LATKQVDGIGRKGFELGKTRINGLTQKQSDFAEFYVSSGGNASAAYRIVYSQSDNPATHSQGGVALMANTFVRREIQRIRTRHRKRHNITIDTTTTMLQNAYDIASDARNAQQMAKIAMDISKLHGLIVEKREIVVRDLDKMESDELLVASADIDQKIKLARKRIAEIKKLEQSGGETVH